jgi:Tfp pilus assembly protein PilV
MLAKLVLGIGVLGVGGYVGHTVMQYDPAVYPYSKAQVAEVLAASETKMPRRTNDGSIRIWADGVTDRGVALKMTYNDGDPSTPVLDCEAVLTVVAADKTRVAADCGSASTDSALAQTTMALQAPMFEEHIESVLGHRAFDRQIVDNKEAALVMKNMGGMQREALKASDEAQREQAGGN